MDQFPILDPVSNFTTATSALTSPKLHDADIVFMDIDLSGDPDVLGLFRDQQVVILSKNTSLAFDAYRYGVLDYLQKPVEILRLTQTIQRLVMLHTRRSTQEGKPPVDFMYVRVEKRIIRLAFDEILYVESLKDYVMVKTLYEDHVVHANLSQFTKLLPEERFIRAHRSFTVAKEKINAFSGNTLEIGANRIPIGRQFKDRIKNLVLETHII